MWFKRWGLGVPGLTYVLVKNGIFKWSYMSSLGSETPLELERQCWNTPTKKTSGGPGFKHFLFLLGEMIQFWLCSFVFFNVVKPPTRNMLALSTYKSWTCFRRAMCRRCFVASQADAGDLQNVHGLVGKFLNISSLRVQNDGNEINQTYFCKLAVSFGFFIFSFCLARWSN